MIKYAVLLFNMLGLILYNLFIADGVTVSQSIPAQMNPGSEYTVEVTINKGSTAGFAALRHREVRSCAGSGSICGLDDGNTGVG